MHVSTLSMRITMRIIEVRIFEFRKENLPSIPNLTLTWEQRKLYILWTMTKMTFFF